jgi:uncharacterized membrane protein YqjE
MMVEMKETHLAESKADLMVLVMVDQLARCWVELRVHSLAVLLVAELASMTAEQMADVLVVPKVGEMAA